MFNTIGTALVSSEMVSLIDAVWVEYDNDGVHIYIATNNSVKIEVGQCNYGSLSRTLKGITDQLTELQKKNHVEKDNVDKRLLELEKRILEIYNAPGMPGYVQAQQDFVERSNDNF